MFLCIQVPDDRIVCCPRLFCLRLALLYRIVHRLCNKLVYLKAQKPEQDRHKVKAYSAYY